ncbi:hypothetical protein [Kordiimonas pumila]|uniref:Solute-binding protein family 3/N-terminal domain-containing protein n=1 Tax=Kordiimonas pumila TaxID=2161677 RepID=A0ABV7D3Z2_9PROT|nr:hypothetical protein [Kordiimonas pumila]
MIKQCKIDLTFPFRLVLLCLTFSCAFHLAPTYAVETSGEVAATSGYKDTRIVQVFAPEVSEALKQDGTGFYNDIWQLALSGFDRPTLTIVPHRRSNFMFINTEGSCRFPAVSHFKKIKDEKAIASAPFIKMIVRAYTKPGIKAPHSPTDFISKKIVISPHYVLPVPYQDVSASTMVIMSERQRATMLLSGRVDIMISSMPVSEFVFRSFGVKEPLYDNKLVIGEYNLSLVCHRTPVNEELIKRFNMQLEMIQQDGSLAALFSRYDIEYDLYRPGDERTMTIPLPASMQQDKIDVLD